MMLATIWTLLRWVWHAIRRGPTRHLVARIEVTCSCGKKFEVGGCAEAGRLLAFCIWCGKVFTGDPRKEEDAALLRREMQEHDRPCEKNPLAVEAKRLRGIWLSPGADEWPGKVIIRALQVAAPFLKADRGEIGYAAANIIERLARQAEEALATKPQALSAAEGGSGA